MDIAAWLRDLGLEQYQQAFLDNAIDVDVLPALTADDLRDIGVHAVGHRRRLLDAIAALRQADAAPAITAPADDRPELAPDTAGDLREGERRQVTVLFADLTGYTALTRELGDEGVYSLMRRFFEMADGAIESFGGTIDKHTGDCVMAIFGAPLAHSNDSERAIRAALAIRERMPALSEELGRLLQVHAGIASGQVVTDAGAGGQRGYTVTGESVNLASRLTDEAAAGEVLISDAVRSALADRLECAEVGELAVKGFAGPVRAWRLLGILPSAEPAARRSFVGRRGELNQIRLALATCSSTGRGQTIVVRGEAGIGKTRLVEEFQREAEAAGFACHAGQALDFGVGSGRDVIRMLVRSLLSLEIGSDETVARTAAEAALRERLVAAERAAYLNDLLDLPQPRPLRALFDAMDNASRNRGKRETVAELVAQAARRRPLLLVVEDLHWAESLALAHLARLTEAVAECPALLVMTTRIEGDPLDQGWRSSTGGTPLITIDLGPLRREEAMVMARTFSHAAASDLAARCVERAAGNPLFLEQLLRHAAEESAEAGVPGSVQSLVQARLDRLDPADKRALLAASVLGQRFSLPALRHLIGEADYDGAGLVAHFLLRPQEDGFLFAHALIRDAVYDSLLKSRRRDLHRAAAAWYAGRDAVLHADHLQRAEDPAAARAYGAAAEAEAAVLRYERALRMAERGLALARTDDETLALAMLQAEYLRELGRPGESIAAFRQALELAADEMARCRAWIGVAAGVRLRGGYDEGMQALDEAEILARRHQADRELAQICYYRGCLLFAAGDVETCVGQHEQAREAAVRAGDPEWEAWTLSGLGDAQYARGRMRLAMEHFRRCRALCHQHGFGRAEVGSTHMIGVTRRYLNEFREAIEDLRHATAMAARVGNRRTEMVALTILGEVLVDHGDFEGAYAALDRAMGIADTLGNRRFRIYGLYELGRALWCDGRRQGESERVLAQALELSREIGMSFLGPRVLAAKALVSGSNSARREALDEGEAIIRSGCLAHVALWFYRDAIEASLNAEDWNAAERYAAALEEYTRPEPLPWADFFIARGRALARSGRSGRDDATMQELRCLWDEANRLGLSAALPSLERAGLAT